MIKNAIRVHEVLKFVICYVQLLPVLLCLKYQASYLASAYEKSSHSVHIFTRMNGVLQLRTDTGGRFIMKPGLDSFIRNILHNRHVSR
jgi:hypothetical protein